MILFIIFNESDRFIITFDNYVYSADDNITIGNMEIDTVNYLHIKIPIHHKLYPNDDFGLNIVYIN